MLGAGLTPAAGPWLRSVCGLDGTSSPLPADGGSNRPRAGGANEGGGEGLRGPVPTAGYAVTVMTMLVRARAYLAPSAEIALRSNLTPGASPLVNSTPAFCKVASKAV